MSEGEMKVDYTGAVIGGVAGQESAERPFAVRKEDIEPRLLGRGESGLVLQVNARDDREESSEDFGALLPEAVQEARDNAEKFFDKIFEEDKDVYVIVYASDAALKTPEGKSSEHKRAYETAEIVIEGARVSMDKHGIAEEQLLNNSSDTEGKPVVVPELVDLKMWEYSESVQELQGLLGEGKKFWSDYESGKVRELVKEGKKPKGVETQAAIAVRTRRALLEQMEFARKFHKEHPDARLLIYTVGFYDNLSAFTRGYLAEVDKEDESRGSDPIERYHPWEKAGGFFVHVDKDMKHATTEISGRGYEVLGLTTNPWKEEA